MNTALSLRLERAVVALVPAGIGAALLFAIFRGLHVPAAFGLSIVAGACGVMWGMFRLPSDGAWRGAPVAAAVWAVLGVGAIFATARLATYMTDETRVENSVYAFDEFFVHHSCLSAHYQAAQLQRAGVANVYERTQYEGPQGEPHQVGSFVIDTYLYPPPMLLLSRAALGLSDDFSRWRAIWFGIEGAIVIGGLWLAAQWIGGAIGRRVAFTSLLVWLSLPTLTTLQFGNFHLVAMAGSVLAMLAFERRRHAIGGATLAALTLFKVFPGILILVLVLERRWRSLAWTMAFALLLLGASYAVLGPGPFEALVTYHLPRMASGEALETLFVHPDVIAANQAIYGLVQKLSLLGVPGTSQRAAVGVTWVFGFLVLGAAVAVSRVNRTATMEDRRFRVLGWLGLLQLASLRAPFTPDTYALFVPLWILVLLLAGTGRSGRRPVALVVLIVLANFMVPTVEIMPLRALLAITLVHQVVFVSLTVGVLAVLWRRAVAPPPAVTAG